MSSTLSFLDQFNAPSTEGGKRISIYTPKHTHVSDSTLLTFLLSNPTDVFNKLKAHNPEATNATDRAALEAYLSTRREYDEAVKAADEAIDHHKRLLHQQDDRVLTELIRLDNLKVAHHFQPLLPCNVRARHNKFIPRAIPNAYLPLPAPLPTSASRRPPIPSPFLQATPRSTTIPADWQPNPGWTPKGSCRRCGSSRHWVRDCPDVRCAGCGKEAPGHLERECGTRPMKRHVSAPPEEPARRVGVVIDNVFLEEIINEAKERKEKERQTKAVPVPPPRSANPEPPTSPIAGPLHPRPDTPVVFRKVDPNWTPDTTQWTWDSSWPHQKHLSGEEWMNVGRNARKEWFDEEEDDGVDWELYGDGEHEIDDHCGARILYQHYMEVYVSVVTIQEGITDLLLQFLQATDSAMCLHCWWFLFVCSTAYPKRLSDELPLPACGIAQMANMYDETYTYTIIPKTLVSVVTGLGASFVGDIYITIALCMVLHKHKMGLAWYALEPRQKSMAVNQHIDHCVQN
ncbi:predicted protein [Postia placenta Mad-698-R]|nr:predicted protein [Postia placenta Mad-698-R]